MARPTFKRFLTNLIPQEIERSTYVLAPTAILSQIIYFWLALGGIIWQLTDPTAIAMIYGVFTIGWAILFLATFQINYFDLFELRQI